MFKFFLLLPFCIAGFIFCAPQSAGADLPPLVQVSRVQSPLSVNGRGSDPAWKYTIAIQDFITANSHLPMKEATSVRLLWDENNLYVFARLDEPLLSTTSQLQSEIKADAKKRDQNIERDDSFSLILRPKSGEKAFEFSVNTRGVVADAEESPANVWGTRNLKWNSGAIIETNIEDGYWTAEFSIPWKTLGVEAPKINEKWQAIIGRNAPGHEGSASWNLSYQGIHDPENWGILIFSEKVPGIERDALFHSMERGKNNLSVAVTPGMRNPATFNLSTDVSSGQKDSNVANTSSTVQVRGGQPQKISHEFDLPGGNVSFTWAIANSAAADPLYRSPAIQMDVQTSKVMLELSTEAPYRLFVNGKAVDKGDAASKKQIPVPLSSGANVIAVEVQSGDAFLKFDSSDIGPAPIGWKIRNADIPIEQINSKDETWTTASETKDGSIGNPGTPSILKHTILVHETRIFPSPRPYLYVAGSGIQCVTFTAFGIPGEVLNDWKVYFETSEAIDLVGATGYYGRISNSKPKFAMSGGDVASKTRHYVVAADKPVLPRVPTNPPVLSVFDVALRQSETAGDGTESCFLRYFARANDNTVSEACQDVAIRLLPKLAGIQPKNLTWQLWGGSWNAMDNSIVREEILKTAQAAGFNNFVGTVSDSASQYGIAATQSVKFKPSSLDFTAWLKDHPENRLINAKGESDDSLMCTTFLLEKGWAEVGAPLLKKFWDAHKVDVIDYDYEYPAFNSPHSCFCDRCIAAFRKMKGIPDEKPLNAAVIRKDYQDQWVDFMARRVALIFKEMKESVHQLSSDVKFEVYSGYQSRENIIKYGVDWKYVGEADAVDTAGAGYGRPIPGFSDTLNDLGKIPVKFGDLVTPYMTNNPDFNKLSVQLTKASLLRRSIDSTGGVIVYTVQNMDGRTWWAAAETTRLVSQFEDIFGIVRASAIPGQSAAEVELLQNNRVALVCIMNPGRVGKNYNFEIPNGLRNGKEFYTGAALEGGNRISINLPAGETAVYVMKNPSE